MENNNNTYIRRKAAREITGLSLSQLDKLCKQRDGIPYIKIGRAKLFNRAELEAWLNRHRQGGAQ